MNFILAFTLSFFLIVSCRIGPENEPPENRAVSLGLYSCESDHEKLKIAYSDEQYLFEYTAISHSVPHAVKDSSGQMFYARKYTASGETLNVKDSRIKFEMKLVNAYEENDELINIGISDSILTKSYEIKFNDEDGFRLREFVCSGIMGWNGCDGYWIYCDKE